MSTNHHFHFPVAILVHNGELITAATTTNPQVVTRLPVGYVADTTVILTGVTTDIASQTNKKGELGNLTAAQRQSVDIIQKWMNLARKTARLAFAGQTVKLHQEFQMGVSGPYDLASFLNRADIIIASVQNAANLAALKLRGWTDADTTAFVAARQSLATVNISQQSGKGGAKDSTTLKNSDAADLYDRLLTIQNAADLQWPANDPANAGIRGQFCLNTFPPARNSSPATPPAPAPPATPAKP